MLAFVALRHPGGLPLISLPKGGIPTKKLFPLLLALLLLAGCAVTYDGPTEEKPMLTEWTVTHYYNTPGWEQEPDTSRTLYAYDIHGNMARSMEYQADKLHSVSNYRYDDRGNVISQTTWDHSGWFPKFHDRTEQTYDGQDRCLSYVSCNFWGGQEYGSWYSYDDTQGICICRDENGEVLQTTWYDEMGNEIRHVSGNSETVYEYDDRGNCTRWVSYTDGVPDLRYEYRYDDQGRQVWGGRYDADGKLVSEFEYAYDDEANTMTYTRPDGWVRCEYYNADGQTVLIEDYDEEGRLSMVQRHTYQNIRIPVKGDDTP